jgi:hypothetical protein
MIPKSIRDIREGDTVHVMSNFGQGPFHVGEVLGAYEDIKNGRPGIDYVATVGGEKISRWAYLYQVIEVLHHSKTAGRN